MPCETPDRNERCASGAMSASSALYGSIAALKKIEKRKIAIASGTSAVVDADATRKNSADSGTHDTRKIRRRPKRRDQMRSEIAPPVGWMTTPSMLRVLERGPVSRSGAPTALSASGSRKLLNA